MNQSFLAKSSRRPTYPCSIGGRPPRILFYSHDSFGLGHIRRTLAVAGEISRVRPNAAMLALTGSLDAHAYELPRNFDYVKLPTVTKNDSGAYVSRSLPIPFDRCWALRERVIRNSVDVFQPDVVIVDHAPAGLQGELVPTLRALRADHPQVRLLLGLRDIVDESSVVRTAWRKEGIYDLLDQVYDRILVYGSQHIFDPIAEYGFSPVAAAKTSFCGYIRKQEPLLPPEEVRDKLGVGSNPLVVLTVGGGGDGAALIKTYFAGLADRREDIATCVVTGPLLNEVDREWISHAAARPSGVTVLPFVADLASYLSAADVVVTMGGYNTVCEAIGLGKRVVVVPRSHPRQEQAIRARRFAQLGLVAMIHPDDLTPDRLQAAVGEALEPAAPAVQALALEFCGLRRAGAAVAALLPSDTAIVPEVLGAPGYASTQLGG